MSVRFILGRAGTGKTTAVFRELEEKLSAQPDGHPLIYIVPEQATFQAEYALATLPHLGGTIRAQVLSFERLAYRLIQESGGATLLPVDETGKQMVLRMLLERHREQLQVFHRSALQPGFTGLLARMISECKSYGITADQLQGREWGTGTLANKLHDLCLLLNAYDGYLHEVYYDTDDMLKRVAESVATSPYIAESEIYLDGFSGFTNQELAIIARLMRHARRVSIVLCLDPQERTGEPDELALFFPTVKTYQRLVGLAREAGAELEQPELMTELRRFATSPWIGQLEANYFSWKKPPMCPQPGREQEIVLYSAASRRAEVQAVALQMLALARQEQYRFGEMAILLRDIPAYADEIANVFTEYGIPYFLDQKRSVLHHPVVELVRSALEVVTSNWRYEAVFRCLKTDLFSEDGRREESREEIDELENYVLAYGIHGGFWKSGEPWHFHGRHGGEQEQIDSIRRRYAQPLLAFEAELKRAAVSNVREMATVLYQFLAELQIPLKLEAWQEEAEQRGDLQAAQEHGQVWNGLLELLDQIVEVMGQEKLDAATFARVLESGLEGIQLGLVPPALNQVIIGSMERSRAPHVKAVFILGANDGVIPMRPQENGILDEAERDRLQAAGIEMAPSAKQQLLAEQFLLYQALTRPSERLWISCALADEEGKGLLPSMLFERVKELIPGVSIQFFHNQPTGIEEADAFLLGRPKQVFSHLLTLLGQVKKGASLTPFWWEVYDWFVRHSPDAEREKWLLSAFRYTNQAQPLAASDSRALYGKTLRMSVSRLERFQACAFSHFASHGLRLIERRTYRLERFDVGELFHASLKRAVDKMAQEKLEWSRLTEEGSRQLANEVVDELVPVTRSSILNRTARYRYLTGKLKRAVGRAIYVLGEHAKRSKFAPVGLEVSFGPGGEIPGITIQLGHGTAVQLIGRIDRVDQSLAGETTYLRVIDYKSSPKKLIMADVWNGLNLQLLVYLDVVVSNAHSWLGKQAEVGGVFYYQVADPFITAGRALTDEEADKERSAKLKMKGLLLADPELAKLMDEQAESGRSDLLPFAFKKDGSFTANSSVATKEQFKQLQRFVRSQVTELSTRLINGEIAIQPYAQGTAMACQTCAYKAVCQFDPSFAGNQPKMLSRWKDHQVWDRLEQQAAEVHDAKGGAGDE